MQNKPKVQGRKTKKIAETNKTNVCFWLDAKKKHSIHCNISSDYILFNNFSYRRELDKILDRVFLE